MMEIETSIPPPITSATARRIPPAVVGGHKDWDEITEMLQREKIDFWRAKTTRDGSRSFLKTLVDSNQMPDEKTTHAVI